MKKNWTAAVKYHALKACYKIPMPTFRQIFVTLTWYEPDRRRDPDNIAAAIKFVLDGMVNVGLIPNDGWKNIAGIEHRFAVDKNSPGVRVNITEAIQKLTMAGETYLIHNGAKVWGR